MTTESKSAFARRLGVAASYITKLAQAGRLIVIDGQIEVETSLALIEQTRDPNRDDVRQRHARGRDEKRQGKPVALPPARVVRQQAKQAPQPAAKPMLKAASVFRKARADQMHYQARMAEMRLAQLQGKLVDVAIVRESATNDGTMLRTLLENLPDLIAPRLAPVRDPAQAARILNEYLDDIEQTLSDLLMKNAAAIRQRPEVGGNAD